MTQRGVRPMQGSGQVAKYPDFPRKKLARGLLTYPTVDYIF